MIFFKNNKFETKIFYNKVANPLNTQKVLSLKNYQAPPIAIHLPSLFLFNMPRLTLLPALYNVYFYDLRIYKKFHKNYSHLQKLQVHS